MITLLNCDRPLKVWIETPLRNWSYIYQIVDDTQISMTNSPNEHPVPYGHTITDHVDRKADKLTINGVLGCIHGCVKSSFGDFYTIVSDLKKLKEEMLWTRDRYAIITSNDWVFRWAILTEVTISESQDNPQIKTISTTWQGANFTGSIRDPNFDVGGIYYK